MGPGEARPRLVVFLCETHDSCVSVRFYAKSYANKTVLNGIELAIRPKIAKKTVSEGLFLRNKIRKKVRKSGKIKANLRTF